MRRILLFCLVAGLPILALSLLLQRFGVAPVLTESISYDLKLAFAAEQNAPHYDILSVGSSITLNNLHSQTLVEAFPAGVSYLNLASFNANIQNSHEILEIVIPYYQPQLVLMMSNHVDFESSKWRGLHSWLAERYLGHELLPYFYIRRFNLYALLQRQRRTRRFMSEARANMQQQMRMDAYGGVPLRVSPENLNPNRQDTPPIAKLDSNQYHALAELASWLKSQGIKLIYIQSPLKKSSCQSSECQSFQERHIERCKQLILAADQQFVDLYHGLTLADSVFCDELHLNFGGPKLATEALIKEIAISID
ncbi:MAG: hypothetical protein AB8H47_04555 [Bacteroidia bacterium]